MTTGDANQYYGDDYYEHQVVPSLESARLFVTHLWKYLQPTSVVDVGCGRGAWLKAFHEFGTTELIGLDGPWNSQTAMIDVAIRFRAVDLDRPFEVGRKVDLAMSVEVAEHLKPSSSTHFVDCLTKATDAVLFVAAYVYQNGPTHTNERRHSFWGQLFPERGFVAFDIFRPALWGDERIPFWYRQNTFLYIKLGSSAYATVKRLGLSELNGVHFLDCVHPVLFELRAGVVPSFRTNLNQLVPSLVRAVRRRIGAAPL